MASTHWMLVACIATLSKWCQPKISPDINTCPLGEKLLLSEDGPLFHGILDIMCHTGEALFIVI